MKPFIYNFLEKSREDFSDTMNLLEYSKDLNLSVIAGTSDPAINLNSLSTQTFTKADGEGSDADQNHVTKNALSTQTQTRADREVSDADHDRFFAKVQQLTGTSTVTLVNLEASDSDHDALSMMLSTRTLTEAKEISDSDK